MQNTRRSAATGTPFIEELKEAVTGDSMTSTVLLGNFEVEEVWAMGETTLPRVGSTDGAAIVNRLDEFGMWLGTASDTVLLKEEPDQDFLTDVHEQGFELPAVLVVDDSRPAANITFDAARAPHMMASVRDLALSGSVLMSHSVSEPEMAFAASVGLPLSAPSADVCKAVNGKVYSRRLADAHDIRQPRGVATENVADWHEAMSSAHSMLQTGRPVVVKEAYGVSGKGLAVVRTEARLRRLADLVARRAEGNADRALFSVEEWIDKEIDLNYQFTVDRDGGHRFDFVKVAATSGGVHLGHSYPASLAAVHLDEMAATAAKITAALHSDGYFGVVGVDAIIDRDGQLYPMLEINARFNMSTYQAKIDELVVRRGLRARAKHYDLSLAAPLSYGTLRTLLADLVYRPGRGQGFIITNFATANAAFAVVDSSASDLDESPRLRPGRLYGVVVGGDPGAVDRLDAEISRRLRTAGSSIL